MPSMTPGENDGDPALDRPADVVAAYSRYVEWEPESTQVDVIRARMDVLHSPVDAGLRSARNR